MVNDNTYAKSLADVTLVFLLPIPQGNSVEIKVEQSQCSFYLNQKIVEQIQQAQKTGLSVNIPPKLLIYLWYCTCFQHNFVPDSRVEQDKNKSTRSYLIFLMNILRILRSKYLQNQTSFQVGCTFNSYYSQKELTAEDYREKDCLLQSVVLFYGDVIQKVKKDFLHNNANLVNVISAHYWLVDQLLSSLRNKLNMLVWEFASLFPSGFLVSKINKVNIFNSNNSVIWLILTWLGLALLVSTSRYIIFKQLQKLAAINYKYLNWLAWGISCMIPAIAMISTQKIQAIDIMLFSIISVVVPLVIQQVLSFIWPQLWKLILRRVL
ncbi:hypothetical protein [Anabaena sp. CCY 9402-a]|uniref:hypothetical protein n=1 Tax=Anabaena sp. CCY 9402-a TaxID=3103867 RepID=UPI0039C65020